MRLGWECICLGSGSGGLGLFYSLEYEGFADVMNISKVLVLVGVTFLVAAGCYLLAFGTLIACCSSVRPGLSFWNAEKLFYGHLSLLASLIIFAFQFKNLK